MKLDANTKESMKHSANTESRTVSNASHKASADTSLPYRLTPSEIESMKQEFKAAFKEADALLADVQPFKR